MKKIEKDITEDAFERIKSMLGDECQPRKQASLLMTPIQKNQLYHYISNMINSGEPHDTIVSSIVVFVSDFLEEKHNEQFEPTAKPKGVFRRAE